MKRTIEGRRYLMRDQRPVHELRELWRAFQQKYRSDITFHRWLVERGKIYVEVRR